MPIKLLPLYRLVDQNYRRKDIYVRQNLPICQNQENKTEYVVKEFNAKIREGKREHD